MRIGVDIGGTKILGGLLQEDQVTDSFRLLSKAYSCPEGLARAVADQILDMIRRNGLSMADIEHIGIGIPGTVDWIEGSILYSPNLFGKEKVAFADCLEEMLDARPTLVQDSWAGAYAEYLLGQEKRYSSMLFVTLGTGIGCGIISNRRVYAGCMGTAGEIGHVSIQHDGRLCSCGRRGCLETYASGTGILRQAMELFPEKMEDGACGAERVFLLAEQGDEQAAALLRQCMDRLAYGLAALMNITGCNVLFISGGLSCHEKWTIAPLAEGIAAYGYPAWCGRIRPIVRRAALGEEAPMIGAALLDKENIRRG